MLKAHTLSLILSLCLIAGCGFQLRSSTQLPAFIQNLALVSDNPYGALSSALRREISGLKQLSDSTETQANSNYRLHINKERTEKRTLSLGKGSSASEYLLIHTVSVTLKQANGSNFAEESSFREQRTLTNNPDSGVSTQTEEQLLKRSMADALARKIALYLQSLEVPSTTPESTP